MWSVWLAGGSLVDLEWSGSSHHGALRQQWQPRALTDSGHYHLLSAPFRLWSGTLNTACGH